MNSNPGGNQFRRSPGVGRMVRHRMKVDMTPMVDLGFLLITFFVITTELTKPSAIDLAMPKEGPPSTLAASNALTLLVTNDRIFYYSGDWDQAVKTNGVGYAKMSGDNSIRDLVLSRQQASEKLNLLNEGSDGLMVLIKPGPDATYHQLVALLDEMLIDRVKKYAVLKPTNAETDWVRKNSAP